jgi:hypothetical protein
MSNIISYLVTIPPFPALAIPILTFEDSVWIAPSNWIVKEFAPSTTLDLSILGFPAFTIPGYTLEIQSIPTELQDENPVVTGFMLDQNYPNPFNPVTKIRYSVGSGYYASHTRVTLKVFDVLGNEVATLVDESKPAGTYEVEFQSTSEVTANGGYASGVYYYQLKAGGFTQSKKMVLLK